MENYKELYTDAWDQWTAYWTEAGVEALYLIETYFQDGLYYCEVMTHVRSQILVHKFKGDTKENMWKAGVVELLRAGAAKVYEDIVKTRREEYSRSSSIESLYPVTPFEANSK